MASHSLAIAKASLAAGMIRPDPNSIPKSQIAHFHDLLDALLKQCSSINIQLCKQWLLENVTPSASRINVVGKYLVALSESCKRGSEDSKSPSTQARGTSGQRKQLHILYLLNDLLHHTKYHIKSPSTYAVLTGNVQPHLVDLFGYASAYSIERYSKHHTKIQDLLDLWDRNDYYQSSYVAKLRETVANAAGFGYPTSNDELKSGIALSEENPSKERKDAPFIMPASHGDSSTPFYDLPAGNMLPHIMPNSITPINPNLMKPLQFTAGPADNGLATVVKDFLQAVDTVDEFGFDVGETMIDVDELGQSILRDEITGDILEGDGYYGWSRTFCEKMKKRGEGFGESSKMFERDVRAKKGPSPAPRRYNKSGSMHSRSSSRSNSARSRQDKKRRTGRSSMSTSRSSSPGERTGHYRSLRSRSHSISRSPSYSPPPVISTTDQPSQSVDPRPLPRSQAQGPTAPQLPPYGYPFSKGFPPLGMDGMPIPPPPPPNYSGPWPPPPPPPLSFSNETIHPYLASPAPLPTGPRTYQSPSAGFPQNSHHLPQNPASWGQQQQQSATGSTFFHGGRGRAQPSFNSHTPNIGSRGLGRGS